MNSALNKETLLEQAKSSTCTKSLSQLATSTHTLVRRAVARNMHTLTKTLNSLARDPVLNVSFMAVQNPKCTRKREFSDISNPCVVCEKDERHMVCVNCPTLENFYNR